MTGKEEREGVIHFSAAHTKAPLDASLSPATTKTVTALSGWRAVMMKLGFVGVDPARYEGVGFGNLSVRVPPFRGPRGQQSAFLVTGTQLGGKPLLDAADVAVVDAWDLRRNRVTSHGPGALPSSESLTHGAVYDVVPHARAVIHVHAPPIFNAAEKLALPTTRADVGYGTVAMAEEVSRLWSAGLRDTRVFAMGGHQDGIVSIGDDLDDAGARLLAVFSRALVVR